MANRSSEVSIWIRARDTTQRVIGEFRRRWQAGARAVKDFAKDMLAVGVAAAGTLFTLTKLGQQGEKVIGLQAAFARTTDNSAAALQRLREASGGAISDTDLMARHNQALALGLARSTEEYARMIEVAQGLGPALGLDDFETLEKLQDVVASGSKRAARELGLEIRAGMTRNEILAEAEEVVSRLGGSLSHASGAGDRFAASMANARDKLAVMVAESPLAAAVLDGAGSLINDMVDVLMGDVDTLVEGMKTLGRLAADAFSLGVNLGLRELLGSGPGSIGSLFQGNVEAALANLVANREALAAIARSAQAQAGARRAAGGGAAGGGGGGGAAAIEADLIFREAGLLSPEALAAYRARQDRLRRDRFGLGGAANVGATGRTMVNRLLGTGAEGDPVQLGEIGVPVHGVAGAALELEDATGVAVESLGRMADSAVNESQRMEVAVIDSFRSIIANIKTKNGLFGSTFLGGFLGVGLGLVGSLLGRRGGREQEIPVRVNQYDQKALRQLEKIEGPIIVEPTFLLPDGSVLTLEQIERGQRDRLNRNERTRPSPRTGRAVSGR